MNKSLSFVLVYDWECPISDFSFFDIGTDKSYFGENENNLFESRYDSKVKNQLQEILAEKQAVALYFSGPFLELLSSHDPSTVKKLKSAKHVTLLGGTYHHSLAALHSLTHFNLEVIWHQKLIKKLFGTQPTCFLNTQNIYFNHLAESLASAGFDSTFTGAIDWYLGNKPDQRIFHSKSNENFKLLLVNQDGGHTLFQDNNVANHFLQINSSQLDALGGWAALIRKTKNNGSIVSVNEQLIECDSDPYNIRQPISSSYDGIELDQIKNYPLQESWLKQLYEIESLVAKKPEAAQKLWSRLGAMCVLKALNPELESSEQLSSYEVYQSLINMLNDLRLSL